MKALDNYTCRLIRCNRGSSILVELFMKQLFNQHMLKFLILFFLNIYRSDDGIEKTMARFVRDRELLLKEYQKHPYDTRTLFYLARTCEDLGELEEAYDFYKKRVEMIGWDEEDFIVHYRLAETIKKLVLQNR